MPIYEYACEQCQKTTEILQKIDEDSPEECPACGASGSMKKVVSNSAFHLKGGGWYKDLYASTKASDDKSSTPTSKSVSNAKDDSTVSPAPTKKGDKTE